MQCPDCRFENRQGRRFCSACGAALASACPSCGFSNDPGENFCGGCGIQVAQASRGDVIESRGNGKPAAPARTDGAGDDTRASRRQLTVMFCDIVGSVALAEQLDPEEMAEVLLAYQEASTEVVRRFGGYVGRYVGDGLLIHFGYPAAHEDDAYRAVRAGLGITQAMRRLNEDLTRLGVTISVRIGIATGLVVAGDIGRGERREKAAIVGETPNLAARLQELASPDSVVIGPSTERLVQGLFVFESLGPRTLKGISQPVTAQMVRGETGVRSQFEAKRRAGLTPLVGRQEEIELLDRRWQSAKGGEGQVVLITGEAGVGKSRVLQGFKERARDELRNRVLYYGSPFYRDTPLYPVIEQLRRGARIQKTDDVAQKLEKLDSAMARIGQDPKELTPLFASLLSLPTDDRYAPLSASPEDLRAKLLEAIVTVIEAMASRSPVLLVVEDLHWVDPSTLELLNLLVGRLPSSRVLLVGTSRPEFEPPWGDRSHVSVITLRRLSPRESTELVEKVTGGKPLPDEVLEQIIDRTDGVPLFVEELTKTALDSGVLEDAGDRFTLTGPLPPFAVPASLHDSLLARLDRLASVKEIAQIAAAIGRRFTHELLAAISELADSALEDALTQLEDAGLIYRHGLPPNVINEFKHALVQDVAYSSLLHSRRQQLHAKIAELLRRQYADTAGVRPEILAHHYREAALPEQSIPYALEAGEAAAARFARTEASAHFQSALGMAKSLPPSEEGSRHRAEIILKLASVASNREQFERELDNLEEARVLAEQIDDQQLLCRVLYWIGRAHYVLGRFDLGVQYAEQALQIAEATTDDDELTSGPVNLLARIHCLRGEPKQATKYGARSLEQMHRLGDRIEEAGAAGVLSFAYSVHGRFPLASDAAERGVKAALETKHLPTLAACYMFRAIVKGWQGELRASLPDFEEALAASQKTGDVFRIYLSHGFRGQTYLISDDPARAEAELTECLALGSKIGTSFHRGAFQAFLAKVRMKQGNVEEALRICEDALRVSADPGQEWSHSIALRTHAEALASSKSPALSQATDEIRSAIETQQHRECRIDLAWSHLVAGRVATVRGDTESARNAFSVAEELFAEMGIPGSPSDGD